MTQDLEELAGKLTDKQRDILHRLADGRKLGLADRVEDRARQGLRKAGLIAHCGKPKRWQISADGLALRNHLLSKGTEA